MCFITHEWLKKLSEERGLGGLGGKGNEITKYKLVVTEEAQVCGLQHREYTPCCDGCVCGQACA